MKLETEGGLSLADPPWHRVETALRQLDVGFGNSCASLSLDPSNYVQTLRGINGFHLEWRITDNKLDRLPHHLASDPGRAGEPENLLKLGGKDDGQPCDMLSRDQVIEAFRCFFDRMAPSRTLNRRGVEF